MQQTYTDQYADLGPSPEAAAYFNDLPDMIKGQILGMDSPPSSLAALKQLVREAKYVF